MDELIPMEPHEHQAGFAPPEIAFPSSLFKPHHLSSQQSSLEPHHLLTLQSQGQEDVSNNFLPSSTDNDSTRDMEDEDDESTSFSTGDCSQGLGDSASNDSQETYSTRSSLRSRSNSIRANNTGASFATSKTGGNNNNSNNNHTNNNSNGNLKPGSRAKSRSTVRRTRGARNDEKVSNILPQPFGD